MNLLSSLLSGFAAAANGTAEIYIRGSSTRATWYGDLEASTSNSSGADITLDAYGSALVYVNQLVDVVVKDEDGKTVRSYGDGYSAPNVEVISPAFTGIDYVTAASAVSEPTTLQAVLDRWLTNSGAPDWKVLIGSTATTLLVALGGLNGLVFNVKSPAYGAVGDGVTNDQAAIQAALAAAVAAGGGVVFFPIGTYLTTTAITWDYRAHIVMMPGASLGINHATNGTLKFSAANSTNVKTIFFGLACKALQSNTGVTLSLEASQKLVLSRCILGLDANSTGHVINATTTQDSLEILDSRIVLNGSAKSAILGTAANFTSLAIERTTFVTPATYTGTVIDGTGSVSASKWSITGSILDGLTNGTVAGGSIWVRPSVFSDLFFDGNTITGALSYGLFIEGKGIVSGNDFNGAGTAIENDGSTVAVIGNRFTSSTVAIGSNGTTTAEGNIFTSVTTRYSGTGYAYVELDQYESLTGAGAAYSPSANTEFTQIVSTGTAPVITLPAGFYKGQRRKVLTKNNSGGNWAVYGFAGSYGSRLASIPAPALVTGNSSMATFIWTDLSTPDTFAWVEESEVR